MAQKEIMHSSWKQVLLPGGSWSSQDVMNITWNFDSAKTVQERFIDAARRGESVQWVIEYQGQTTSKVGTWWFSDNSDVASAFTGGSGTDFSSDDGAWGAASGSVNGDASRPSGFWGHGNFNSADSTCADIYAEGVAIPRRSALRNYMSVITLPTSCAPCPGGDCRSSTTTQTTMTTTMSTPLRRRRTTTRRTTTAPWTPTTTAAFTTSSFLPPPAPPPTDSNQTWSSYWYYYWYWKGHARQPSSTPAPTPMATPAPTLASPTPAPTRVPTVAGTCSPRQWHYNMGLGSTAADCDTKCSNQTWCVRSEFEVAYNGMCELYDCYPQWSWDYFPATQCREDWRQRWALKFDVTTEHGDYGTTHCKNVCANTDSCVGVVRKSRYCVLCVGTTHKSQRISHLFVKTPTHGAPLPGQ